MTSPTAIPSPTWSPAERRAAVHRLREGSARRTRERHALDVSALVLQSMGPDAAEMYLAYAHPWVQTGETA